MHCFTELMKDVEQNLEARNRYRARLCVCVSFSFSAWLPFNSSPPTFLINQNSDRFTQNLSAFKQEVKAILV
jgi:hypothetical protein